MLEMSDVKDVIVLLCKHLNLFTCVTFKPEYFRLAKYNEKANHVVEALWTILHVLSSYAVKENQENIIFEVDDKVTMVKLHFAYLQYPAIDFYSLSHTDDCSTRELLLAFAWLLGSQNVLSTTIRRKIASSILGQEYSCTDTAKKNNPRNDRLSSSIKTQMSNIVHTCGKINHNLKEISELMTEKVKLATKVHAASIDTSGLPHLSVSEVALTKRFSTINSKDQSNKKDRELLHELHTLAVMLDVHSKWTKKQHIFFDWMTTVIEQHKNSRADDLTEETQQKLLKFICLLRHVIKRNLYNLKCNDTLREKLDSKLECASRLLRIQRSDTETEHWILETTAQLKQTEEEAKRKKEKLTAELKTMLQLISHCVQV